MRAIPSYFHFNSDRNGKLVYNGSYIIRQATLSEILPLRQRVLRPDKPINEALFDGDEDLTTFHFAAIQLHRSTHIHRIETGITTCCATFMLTQLRGSTWWQLRGMATAPEHLGRRLGNQVLGYGMRHMRGTVKNFWCNARLNAVTFYEKQG